MKISSHTLAENDVMQGLDVKVVLHLSLSHVNTVFKE